MKSAMLQATQQEKTAMAQQHQLMTEDEYLQSELTSDVKREYIDGRVYAMAGAKHNHNCISMNIAGEFRNHLKGTPCTTYISDMKVRAGKNFFYPDVLVDCSKISGDDYFSASPEIIVEVLSKSTRMRDTTIKLVQYFNLPTLKEYVLIEQDIVSVQMFRRSNNWKSEYFYLGDKVTFETIGLTLLVEEIYDRVDNSDMNEFKQPTLLPKEE